MVKTHNVLIIDDHPLISDSYKDAFLDVSTKDEQIEFSIDIANNCDIADEKIKIASLGDGLDIVFLDIRLPPSSDKKILSGEDLGIKIRKMIPGAKIIIATTFNDNYRIHSIYESINPDGFLIKNDITDKDVVMAIKAVIIDNPYYSTTVVKLMRKHMSNSFRIDSYDRQMLYQLSIGTKMKDLPGIIHLSMAAIEKRKRILKEHFNIEGQEDKVLIAIAKEKGFI